MYKKFVYIRIFVNVDCTFSGVHYILWFVYRQLDGSRHMCIKKPCTLVYIIYGGVKPPKIE